ncbi:MAG: carbon-nitrogen hydrolase family protein [Planctomycetia bacterium]|nr:carbon-nitrogen hydrolase family protein [Planctomycetia bacterium]
MQARRTALLFLLGFCLSAAMVARAEDSAPSKPAQRPAEVGDSQVRVAGIVLKWIRADKQANYRRIEPMIRAAAAGGARIVCTTECFLDGYAIADKSIPLDAYRSLGEQIPGGVYFERLAQLADDLDIHLIAGMLEADGEARYNTAVLLGPDGKLIGKYHKQKLEHELVRNTPGNTSSVFATPFGKLGVMICADRTEQTIVRGFCARGADFLICPSGGMFGPEKNDPIVQARSRENGVHIVFVHPAEFLVTSPSGAIITAELVGDRLLIDAASENGEADRKEIRYFDLPLHSKKEADSTTGALGPDALINGDFSVWDGYMGKGVTTTSVGVPPKSIPEHWYGGPGVGATATYDVVPFALGQRQVPGDPKRHLRVTWQTAPSADWPGETHHQPAFRFSFLENFSIADVRRFAGQSVVFSFHARAATGAVDVIPIMWHSYDAATAGIAGVKGAGYELFEASGFPGVVAVAKGAPRPQAICRVTDHWQRFEKTITLPTTDGKSITPGHYTGVGFDFDARGTPSLDLANIEIRPILPGK